MDDVERIINSDRIDTRSDEDVDVHPRNVEKEVDGEVGVAEFQSQPQSWHADISNLFTDQFRCVLNIHGLECAPDPSRNCSKFYSHIFSDDEDPAQEGQNYSGQKDRCHNESGNSSRVVITD